MAIGWTPARLEVDLNYKSKDIVLASEWNNLWKETRLQGNNNTDGIVLLIEIVEGNVTHLTNLDNLFADLESKVTAHTGNSDIHVTSIQKTAWTAKYDKPNGGIPKTDLASSVQSSLEKADSALQQHQDISALTNHVANNNIHVTADNKTAWNAKYDKPADGIPKTDLASGVQTSLNKADTALQQHQDISDLVSHTQNSNIHVTSEQKTAWSAKYDKPSSGIPKTDLSTPVQTSLGKADTALQEHQDISVLTNHVANNSIHVPVSGTSDAGKMLTVDNSGNPAWTEATPSGSSGADSFLVTFTLNEETGAYTVDKTFAEIITAYEAGKIVLGKLNDSMSYSPVSFIGKLSTVSGGNSVVFTFNAFSGSGMLLLAFMLRANGQITPIGFSYYSSEFSQYTILTAGWNANTKVYSFEADFPNSTCDIEIELDSTATESQVEAWSNAKPTAVFGANKIKALGDVPTVDIPVIVKAVVK